MRIGKLLIILFILTIGVGCLHAFSKQSLQIGADRAVAKSTSITTAGEIPIPIFPLILSYDYETKYFTQWIADCPQYSMIFGSFGSGKDGAPIVEISLVETKTDKRSYYSNFEPRVKARERAGLDAHFVKIDFQTGEDNESRPACAFGFADKNGVPIRWRFVLYGPSSDKGAGPRVQDIKNGLLVLYNELGTTAAPASLVQVGDKSYEIEEWPEISKPPYFVGYRGTFSEGIAIGTLLQGVEDWRVQTAPSELSQGAKWILINDKNVTRELQIIAKRGDELTISEITDKTPWARGLDMVVNSTAQGFALKSITRKTGTDAMRISFTPALNLSTSSGTAEYSFQLDEQAHEKVITGSATVEVKDGKSLLTLHPKLEGLGRQSNVQKGYAMTSTITTEANGYRLEVR